MLHRESETLYESMMAEFGAFVRTLDTSLERARATLVSARAVGKTLAAFNKTRQLADERIAAMQDLPDELARKRLEKARHEAEESAERCEEELRKTADQT